MSEIIKPTLVEVIDHGDIVVKLETFKDKYSAFQFYYPQGKTLEGSVAHLNKVTKGEGDKTALAMINSNFLFRFRGRAKQMLKDDAENSQRVVKGETLLITAEEALTYEPGTRDSNSEQGLRRQFNEACKAYKEAKEAGNSEEQKLQASRAVQLRKQLDELMAKALEEMDALASQEAA